jgi:integrase
LPNKFSVYQPPWDNSVSPLRRESGRGRQQCKQADILKRAKLTDFRFHDLRHTWASWHRHAGTSTDELKDLGRWKSRVMVDRYATFATENLSAAAARIESVGAGANVIELTSRFPHGTDFRKAQSKS